METKLKDCTTCKHHQGKKSIDDVANECYPCVHHYSRIGFYPNWEAAEDIQGYDKTIMHIEDFVNSPKHYTKGGIETIDFIRAKLGKDGTIAYCLGNVMKYTTRWKDKGGLEDLKKAQWYLEYAINLMEADE
jgi:hypothetical protein